MTGNDKVFTSDPLNATPFNPTGPLPSGRLAIQASAGTGKTYALAGLAARYVLEQGIEIGEVLLVTFTRAAAAELRDRVRSKLVEAANALDQRLTDPDASFDDEVISWLCGDDLERRRNRARVALADFDSAVITTIHGFAQQVLGTLGVAGGNPDAALGDDAGELLHQVCVDVLVGESLSGRHPVELLPDLKGLLSKSKTVTGNPDIAVVPSADVDGSNEAAAVRRELIDLVIEETEARRRRSGLLSFDDLLTRLCEAVEAPGNATVGLLRSRFRVALIDEFQDTDPVQWKIFSSVFGAQGSNTSLVLVGDPKQAIYGFRGADIHTYRGAIRTPDTEHQTLQINWRSDAPLLKGVGDLLGGATFGAQDIAFSPVRAAAKNAGHRIRANSGEDLPAVSLRLVIGEGLQRGKTKPFRVTAGDARRVIYADLAQHVRAVLTDAVIPDKEGPRAVKPGDVAVLVTANAHGPDVRNALVRAGIPAVITSGDSVMHAPAFQQWRWLLEAVAQPAHPGRARTACLSWFLGWSAEQLAEASDTELGQAQEMLHRWSEVLVNRGAVDFLRAVRSESGVAARLLVSADGDRAITDLDHIGELLIDAAPPRVGPAGLLATLNRLKESTAGGAADLDVAARRVESDADAVQILTVHTSKGLEFPIVLCPTMWQGNKPKDKRVIYQDPVSGRRTVDIACDLNWPDKSTAREREKLANAEDAGERMRLLYVALTRAQHQVVLWWSSCKDSDASALARVLFARQEGQMDPVTFNGPRIPLPSDEETLDFLQPLLRATPGIIRAEVVGRNRGTPTLWQGSPEGKKVELAVAKLNNPPDRKRRRWSFSSISSSNGEFPDPSGESVADDAASDEDPGGDAEPDHSHLAQADATVADGSDSLDSSTVESAAVNPNPESSLPLGPLVGGREFGNLVHRVLEHSDFAAEDLRLEISEQVAEAVRWEGLQLDQQRLTAGLCATITTPLGPLCDGKSLGDFATTDRLDELGFEFTLGEGGNPADDSSVGTVLLDHLAHEHPLRPWAESLSKGEFGAHLAGHLTGFVDVILRVGSASGADKFVVVDYKTNVLTPRGSIPTLADYHPDRLPAAMAHSHYPLQALLYSVALHRYLRWRLPEYDPAVNLGGIAYLFVRGMVGPATPTVDGLPHGVFSWQPEVELVIELSDVLDGIRSEL